MWIHITLLKTRKVNIIDCIPKETEFLLQTQIFKSLYLGIFLLVKSDYQMKDIKQENMFNFLYYKSRDYLFPLFYFLLILSRMVLVRDLSDVN